jgi:hypothetical protein
MHRHTVVSSGWKFEAATNVLQSDYRTIVTYKDKKMYATVCVPCEHDVVYKSRRNNQDMDWNKGNSAAFNGIARLEEDAELFEYLRLVNTDRFQNRSILVSQKGVWPLPRAPNPLTLQTPHVHEQRNNIQNVEDLGLTAASAEYYG